MNEKQYLEEILSKLGSENVPKEAHKIAEKTSEQFRKTLLQSRQCFLWETIKESTLTKLTVAAVIVIGVFLGYNIIGSIGEASPCLANVLERIYMAKTVTYTQTTKLGADSPLAMKVMMAESGQLRCVMPQGNIMIADYGIGTQLHLIPQTKNAILLHQEGRPRGGQLFNYLDWVSKLHEKDGELMGKEEINGQTANVFLIKREFEETTIWVDPKTNLPVRVERVNIPNPDENSTVPNMSLSIEDLCTGRNEKEGAQIESSMTTGCVIIGGGKITTPEKRTTIMSDFVWDAQLDESLFSLAPPEGYIVQEKQVDISSLGEKHLIEALTLWIEMSDGLFPPTINDLGNQDKVKPMVKKKCDKDQNPKEELEQAMQIINKMLKGLMFAQQQKVIGNWYYTGADVRFGDSDTPICWWKNKDSDIYRVIYGNLSVSDSPVMPNLEKED